MSDKMAAFFGGAVLGAAFALALAGCLVQLNWVLKDDAIKHNAAHYDAKTAAFTWNSP